MKVKIDWNQVIEQSLMGIYVSIITLMSCVVCVFTLLCMLSLILKIGTVNNINLLIAAAVGTVAYYFVATMALISIVTTKKKNE